ncbi:hypothetical protein [Desulforegula conservatrix]|uniref:hypothetical protein n=1 Tax=Desulforegula conservatrix TaxID=153026 RepID=UPI00047F6DD2|nr:hypothetical protein [Desulforegula conservatrix]
MPPALPVVGDCSTGKDIAKKAKESIPKKVKTKRCARCKKWFPLEVYRRDDASISISYFSRCPACRAKYYAENKELKDIEREVNL